MSSTITQTFILALTLTLLLFAFAEGIGIRAQVMESTNYRLQSDSLNFGGGRSSSTSYVSESTFGEVATGGSDSDNYGLNAGFQQMQEVYLAMTAASDVTMSPTLGGIVGGTSTGATSVTVTTDNPAGYQLTIEASSSPAMQSGVNSIADYAPTGGDPDYDFIYASNQARFGFAPDGTDVATRFRDDGGSCGGGGNVTPEKCWDGLSTTPAIIASRTSGNHPDGTLVTIDFQVGIGTSVAQPEGTYVATTTLTLLAL